MKTLCVIRHGKSSWDNPGLSDRDRPLKKRGIKDGKKMGAVLKKLNIVPDLMISSPAKRAYTTACLIADEVDYNDPVSKDDSLYFEGDETFIKILDDIDDKVKMLFLFSHNPDITNFANEFSKNHVDNVPTTGTVCIEFDVDSWKQADKSNGRLKFIDYPSRHR